ncbi:alanine--glyoxylate aminotransferase family protein [Ensifer sp. YR511]|uniref:pyridoxal-phosphate-dependent aminotransferase family protein n=1 Tax=Ensifer sp. YR511 TaxID=1855294 RepID=UPI00088A7E8D|nr:aminotransferase class V-fold PLP-dependent enzyme [Ensifer sp. YR511]SDN40826.1 alanine-glyoxylate transaminase / serine-glyoxylate transaminase / serine-pyruvate transaminase [Ensifer sp. YR511]
MSLQDVLFNNPGPTNIPSSVLEAMRRPVIDYRGSEFYRIRQGCLNGLGKVLKTESSIVVMPATGHGAWETALVNLFSPGDELLSLSLGYFGDAWARYARKFGLKTVQHKCDRRHGVNFEQLERELRADLGGRTKGILVTHCETSTGIMTDVAEVRRVLERTGHPALLLVDVISSLGCADFRMDAWKVDVACGAVQKGLMMPAGLCFLGVSEKALSASRSSTLPKAYWDWNEMLVDGRQSNFPGTAPVQMFYGLEEALRLIDEEGLEAVHQRHQRIASCAKAAVRTWSGTSKDIALFSDNDSNSPSLTTIVFKRPNLADRVRETALSRHKVQLGGGIGELEGILIRIGHMGKVHDGHLLGALAGLQAAMRVNEVDLQPGGLDAAIACLVPLNG